MAAIRFDWRRKAFTVTVLVAGATLAGPFGTYEDMTLSGRLIYWSVAVLGCGAIMEGLVIVALTHPVLRLPPLARLSAAVTVGSFPAALIVLSLEHGLRGYPPTPDFALRIWLLVLGISFLVCLVEYRGALNRTASGAAPPAPSPQAPAAPAAPPVAPAPAPATHGALFFRALDPELGRSLVSLTKQDHYLRVATREGEALILKRMADAVAELDGYPGFRIHRSHWVALDAVTAVEREAGRCVAVLDDGRRLPVSRSKAEAFQKAVAARDAVPVPPARPDAPDIHR